MNLRARIAKKIPQNILNNFLLSFPSLYKTKFINFESYLDKKGIQDLIKGINDTKDLTGNIIECGCARCGTSVILASFLKSDHIRKKFFALDSFSGFEKNELKNEKIQGFTDSSSTDFTYNSYDYVVKKIKKLGLSDILIPVKGYFQKTLPKINSNFCMSFIDCDLSESMKYVAETIWPRLSSKGMLFFDDYVSENFKGVKLTVDKFVEQHKNQIERCEASGRLYYIKKI